MSENAYEVYSSNQNVYSRIASLRFADAPYGHPSWCMEMLSFDFNNIGENAQSTLKAK